MPLPYNHEKGRQSLGEARGGQRWRLLACAITELQTLVAPLSVLSYLLSKESP